MSKQDELEEVIEIDEKDSNQDESDQNSSADTLRILEALLFASDELLTPSRLKSILPGNPDAKQIRKMVDKINVQLQKERHPFEIVEIGGGYQFRTVSFYHTWVRQIFKEKASKKLSVQALECLAIIAYKQPISKAEIEAIRGVVSDGAMKTLLEKRLVVISGRSEKPGRPLLYSTSNEFLKYFGLNKLSDLPRIEEFEAIAREKMEELSIEELQKGEEENPQEEEAAEAPAEEKGSEKHEAAVVEESATQEESFEGSEEVPEAESTAVFEISLDEDDNGNGPEEMVGASDESIDQADHEVFKGESEEESIEDSDKDLFAERSDEIDTIEEFNVAGSAQTSNETCSAQSNSETGSVQSSQNNETFDLGIAFEAEDIDEVLPSVQQNEKASVNEEIRKDQDSSTGQAEEEVLEIFLPEDEVGSDQGDDNEKK